MAHYKACTWLSLKLVIAMRHLAIFRSVVMPLEEEPTWHAVLRRSDFAASSNGRIDDFTSQVA